MLKIFFKNYIWFRLKKLNMKKLKLKSNAFSKEEVLTRSQLKKVLGGDGSSTEVSGNGWNCTCICPTFNNPKFTLTGNFVSSWAASNDPNAWSYCRQACPDITPTLADDLQNVVCSKTYFV